MNEYLSNLISILPGLAYWKDLHGVYRGCNLEHALFLGFSSPEEIIGKTDFDLSPNVNATKISKDDKDIILTRQTKTEVEEITKKDKSMVVMLSKKTPLFNDAGEVIGIIGISVDITKEKEADKLRIEAAEREAQHLRAFQDLIDLLPAHIYWKDKKGLFVQCNLKQAQSLGFNSKEEIIGKGDIDLYPLSSDVDRLIENDRYVMSTKQVYSVEEFGKFPDGKDRVFLSKKFPTYDIHGEVDGIFGISIDITAEKELQKKERILQQQGKSSGATGDKK